MVTSAASAVPRRELMRDPVLVLPVAVLGGLLAGWVGVRAHVAGTRVATDLALAWVLAAAFVTVVERPRRQAAGWALAAAAFALLAADLEWSSSRSLWTLGF